jgi:hypothetical protein
VVHAANSKVTVTAEPTVTVLFTNASVHQTAQDRPEQDITFDLRLP